jgi:hypothetical protein
MVGYYSAFGLEHVPGLSAVVGLIGFSLIAIFLYSMLRAMLSDEDNAEEAAVGASDWPLVLAVSWDALWSGPAKAAQAVGWTTMEVLLSFPLAGLVVALAATASTFAAGYLEDQALKIASSSERQVRTKMWGVVAEVGIFSYFGFLALFTFTFRMELSGYAAALTALATMLTLRLAAGRRIKAKMALSTPHP